MARDVREREAAAMLAATGELSPGSAPTSPGAVRAASMWAAHVRSLTRAGASAAGERARRRAVFLANGRQAETGRCPACGDTLPCFACPTS